ncbi:hypothetical protein B0J15DRAFT_499482 [Fusarium solani]|uniref:Uncharacterized protein n=1 Tax=Fusarium solani TaxID=169388 RepID=A0A9P9GXX6_FUSSL|nr:uncharacterized protein B0J15DRAFT_499482 [Fusarium solani]KAH7246785.1 hypothetical protein B0J15DRAFT_499482 [Fusarium solani]
MEMLCQHATRNKTHLQIYPCGCTFATPFFSCSPPFFPYVDLVRRNTGSVLLGVSPSRVSWSSSANVLVSCLFSFSSQASLIGDTTLYAHQISRSPWFRPSLAGRGSPRAVISSRSSFEAGVVFDCDAYPSFLLVALFAVVSSYFIASPS